MGNGETERISTVCIVCMVQGAEGTTNKKEGFRRPDVGIAFRRRPLEKHH